MKEAEKDDDDVGLQRPGHAAPDLGRIGAERPVVDPLEGHEDRWPKFTLPADTSGVSTQAVPISNVANENAIEATDFDVLS